MKNVPDYIDEDSPRGRAAAELEAQGLPLVAPLVGNESKYAVVANAVRSVLAARAVAKPAARD